MDKLNNFKYTETLSTNSLSKITHLLGTINGENCIVSVSRTVPKGPLEISETHILEINGTYSWGLANWNHKLPEDPSVKIDVIYPATETHINKYREQPVRTVTETPEIYDKYVSEYIKTQRGDRLDWIRAIVHDGAEADQVLHRDADFLLLPNQRWDRQTLSTLYLMVIFLDESLASIRDLTAEHIPLLRRIEDRVLGICKEKYGLESHKLKLYFHYHPSYYQMHIHVAHVELQQLDFGRSILVDNVIDMLEARPKGLKGATLSYILGEGHKLAKVFKENGV